MRDFRTIEIDLDIHKAIEAERVDFAELPNDILRRLLELGPAPHVRKLSDVTDFGGPGAWSGKGATLAAGTTLRMSYNGESHEAVIEDGRWLIKGQKFSSPSGAASAVARTREGNSVNLDGWEYWYYCIPGTDEWRPLKDLKRIRLA